MYAMIIVSLTHPDVDRIFDYIVPEAIHEQLQLGMRVMVPFGKGNKKTEGYVIGFSETTEIPKERLKEIAEVMENTPLFSEEMLTLARFMQQKYYTTLSRAMQTLMPAGIKMKTDWLYTLQEPVTEQQLTEKEQEAVAFLIEAGGSILRSQWDKEAEGDYQAVWKSLERKGILHCKQVTARSQYKLTKRQYTLAVEKEHIPAVLEEIKRDKRKKAQWEILEYLEKRDLPVEEKEILEQLQCSKYSLEVLVKKGYVSRALEEMRRNALSYEQVTQNMAPCLTTDQQRILAQIRGQREEGQKKPILLYGVTGSGKTEIYLQVIADVLAEGKQAIVLVPEISLTPQTVNRFVGRFGRQVTVTHSKLSLGERYDQWKRARDGEVAVMIGPRSAVFAPFTRLGAIIIDEEHEASYQSETAPKYDAREIAKWRGGYTGAIVLMGSATPSLSSYYQAEKGVYTLLKMKKRVKESMLPQVAVCDMRQELAKGNHSIFSRSLYQGIKETLQKGQQTILFLNRRGFSTFVSCRICGHVMICDNCNVSYTYHASTKQLICHYCGKIIPVPQTCPACGSKYIRYFGTGTQKVEAEVQKYFPQARVLRMDFDTTGKKHSMEQILSAFSTGEADILVGTQMIAKGHDFPNVTLVGIIAADLSLNCGDYRGAETTFSLLTQVAGRAGRDKLPGFVVIQTYSPDNYAIQYAAKQDYEGFYAEEIRIRRAMLYPPFSHIFTILASGRREEQVIAEATRVFQILQAYNRKGNYILLGPSPAVISKIRQEYRWRIIVKGLEEKKLTAYILYCMKKYIENGGGKAVLFNITLDPPVIV